MGINRPFLKGHSSITMTQIENVQMIVLFAVSSFECKHDMGSPLNRDSLIKLCSFCRCSGCSYRVSYDWGTSSKLGVI